MSITKPTAIASGLVTLGWVAHLLFSSTPASHATGVPKPTDMPPQLVLGVCDPFVYSLPGVSVSWSVEGEDEERVLGSRKSTASGLMFVGPVPHEGLAVTCEIDGFDPLTIDSIALKDNTVYFLAVVLEPSRGEPAPRKVAWDDVAIRWPQDDESWDDTPPRERRDEQSSFRMRWPITSSTSWPEAALLCVQHAPEETTSTATLSWDGARREGTIVRPWGSYELHLFTVPGVDDATLELSQQGFASRVRLTDVDLQPRNVYSLSINTDVFYDEDENTIDTRSWDTLTPEFSFDAHVLVKRAVDVADWSPKRTPSTPR